MAEPVTSSSTTPATYRPYTLVAELTYRCPLRCLYCSNPVQLAQAGRELDTATWCRVLGEAEALGVLEVNLTGGEPALRDDLEEIVQEARRLELYTNLITSAVPFTRDRLVELCRRGLDAVQISFQDVDLPSAERIAGRDAWQAKLDLARWTRELGRPLTINVVLHRQNLERTAEIIALAEGLGADRLELANTQYLGWALVNRAALLPTRDVLERARQQAAAARDRLRGRMEVLFVLPDYHADFPRTCMDGWGQRYLVVAPDGTTLPCQAAHTITSLHFPSVRDQPLDEIWRDSPAFQSFRGEAWMSPTCRTCERKSIDLGGCRCQAFQLTGDASATDPVCSRSPDHALVEEARHRAEQAIDPASLRYRRLPTVA
jgi:pyrroloquinoline quinone biosynthesis protein E